MSLEESFHEAMLNIHHEAGALKPPYHASGFLKLVRTHGGKATADMLLSKSSPSEGFTELFLRGPENLKLSVEYLVLGAKWSSLFTTDQLSIAKSRLLEVNCPLPADSVGVAVPPLTQDIERSRASEYESLLAKMEAAGFCFQKKQKPYMQSKREDELKFIHPALSDKFDLLGFENRSKKYYIKQISDDPNSKIGLVTAKSNQLYRLADFTKPNEIDTFESTRAWVNKPNEECLDQLLNSIVRYVGGVYFESWVDHQETYEKEISKSQVDTPQARLARLKLAPKIPVRKTVRSSVFIRNPDVVAQVLFRANGRCEICSEEAPFQRKKDNTPFLEVHHNTPLSKGGEDTIENAIGICPNCHREQHFG